MIGSSSLPPGPKQQIRLRRIAANCTVLVIRNPREFESRRRLEGAMDARHWNPFDVTMRF